MLLTKSFDVAMQEQSNAAYHEGCPGTKYCLQLSFLRMAAYLTGHADSSQRATHLGQLLSVLLHPQVESRATAEQMQQLKWLRQAAAVPLSRCPCAI